MKKNYGVRLAILQFGFELDRFPGLIKWNRSRQDGGVKSLSFTIGKFLGEK